MRSEFTEIRLARGRQTRLETYILLTSCMSTVSKVTDRPVEELTWEALRRKASVLGIPAWKLAENFAVHERNGELVFKVSLEQVKT